MEINGVQFDGGGHAHGIQSTSNNCADVDVHNNSWRSINPWDQSGFAICDALIDLSGGSYNWHIKGDSSMATAGNRLACYPSSANNPAINNGGSAYNSETWGPVDTPEFFTWGMTPMAVGSVNIGPATNLFLCYYDSTAYRAKCSQGTNAAAGSFDTLVFASTTDTLANKTLSSPVIGPASTVASLPTCNAGAQDQIRIVTDANAPTYNATVAGGGAVRIPVYCNGSNWVSH
ncbi:MAG: hypothetical protein JO033_04755 [Acidobacteriaceae bacterium]|nr:hypothetical protein [Acidobacteriaceae bacterium]